MPQHTLYINMANIKNMETAQVVLNHKNITTEKSFFGLKTRIIYTPTGTAVKAEEYELNPNMGDKLIKILNTPEEKLEKAVAAAGKVETSQIGHYHLETFISEDKAFAAMQIFRFVDFVNVPASDLVIYEGNSAAILADIIK